MIDQAQILAAAPRFWEKVQKTDGCWLWLAGKNNRGYGSFGIGSRIHLGAHVYSFLLHHGPYPKGSDICHSCDNPGCVNPAHLSAKPHRENILEASGKGRMYRPSLTITHCKRGHEYTPDNTYYRKDQKGRKCRVCIRAKQSRAWQKHKARKLAAIRFLLAA